ncbi:hypothetical protein E4L95_02260 [Paracoccus liaowanqingii]|uniref:Uncharacterized protein n=1 Tax=Paracoccus liaowanqingii TaxID=2560053 RepID=A0A4Z1CS09_9RHOB|nr:hypothetical protein [Paracoccus liaowanqingii]TGN68183.1 hypothetical protein E4L95_02260 [Paracoccus liaowanqingii]
MLTLLAAEAAGARERLVHLKVEAMLRTQGLMLGRDKIGRELMEARAGSDPEALRLARWAVCRLEGQGALMDLPALLGLHYRAHSMMPRGHQHRPPSTGRQVPYRRVDRIAMLQIASCALDRHHGSLSNQNPTRSCHAHKKD